MSGFKNTTRTISGHHHWGGGSIGGGTGGTINRLARGGAVDKVDANPGHAEVYAKEGDRLQGNSATLRKEAPTQELEERGGKSPLISKFKKGGPTKHFHVHKHFHAKGGRTHTVSHSYGAMEKHAETYADGGHVHDSTEVPAGGPDYAKGGRHWIQGAIKHPGAFKAKAKHAGMSTQAYAAKVTKPGSSASTKTKRQAGLAKTLNKVRPVKKNAGGALYAPGGPVGALGRLAMRPRGLPMRGTPPMRRPMGIPAPGGLAGALSAARAAPAPTRQPLVADPGIAARMTPMPASRSPLNAGSAMARGGPVGMRTVARQEVAKHVRTAPPRGHGVR